MDNQQLITFQLLEEDQIRSQILASIDLIKNSMPTQVDITVNFLQITTRSNFLISALNTNVYVEEIVADDQVSTIGTGSTQFFNENNTYDVNNIEQTCAMISPTVPAGFYSLSLYDSSYNHFIWPQSPPDFIPIANTTVDGFFGGCTPLDALLVSTLDCLYNTTCLQNFADYFPNLNQAGIIQTFFSIKQFFLSFRQTSHGSLVFRLHFQNRLLLKIY